MRKPAAATPHRARGFALLIVLWTMVLLSLIVTHLASTGRSEANIALNLANEARAEAAADGAVYETLFRLLDSGDRHWAIEGTGIERRLKLSDGEARIRVVAETGKINPNIATPELFQALLQTLGVEAGLAGHIAAAVADWREAGDLARPNGAKAEQYRAAGRDYGPPAEPFQSVDELGLVLGMTPEILAALRPHVTVYTQGQADPNRADPVVLAALRNVPLPPTDNETDQQPQGIDAVDITVEARLASGAGFIRHAIVRLGPASRPAMPSWCGSGRLQESEGGGKVRGRAPPA